MTKQKVLVVDDEAFICRALTYVLRKGDFEVFEARDGEQALAAIEAHKPDLVFLDVMMPKLNGFEVTARLRQDPANNGLRIVLLTAQGQDCDRDSGRRAGADAYITKPFSPTKILEQARDLLAGR
ncbi:MAG: hypothetical protein RLZZ246_457 [Planctomycetota bacterium]